MQSSQRHLGQSIGMVVLFAIACISFITLMSQIN